MASGYKSYAKHINNDGRTITISFLGADGNPIGVVLVNPVYYTKQIITYMDRISRLILRVQQTPKALKEDIKTLRAIEIEIERFKPILESAVQTMFISKKEYMNDVRKLASLPRDPDGVWEGNLRDILWDNVSWKKHALLELVFTYKEGSKEEGAFKAAATKLEEARRITEALIEKNSNQIYELYLAFKTIDMLLPPKTLLGARKYRL
jgi:hypothetical protein